MMKKGSILFLAIFLVMGSLLFLTMMPMPRTEAGDLGADIDWWDVDWDWRQEFNVTNHELGSLTNYQIRLTIEYEEGSSVNNTMYANEKCKTDFGDIRFVTDGGTALDYWLEVKTDSDVAYFWVELDALDNDGENFFVYYGNAGASTTSNGTTTFPDLFDDFNDGAGSGDFDTDLWTQGSGATWGGEIFEENGYLLLNDTTKRSSIWSNAFFSGNKAVTFSAWFKDVRVMGWGRNGTSGAIDGTGDCVYWKTETSDALRVENDGVGVNNAYGITEQAWVTLCAMWDTSPVYAQGKVNHEVAVTDVSTGADGDPTMCAFFYIYNGDAAEYLKLNWVFIRNYQYHSNGEPCGDEWGSETTHDPEVDQASSCTNIDDSTELYARYRLYEFAVYVSDPAGYADIDYVELTLNSTGDVWRVRYDEDTDTFSEELNPTYIDLDASSTATESGNDIDIVFKLYIEWAHPGSTLADLNTTVIDSNGGTDTRIDQTNYNVHVTTALTDLTVNDGSGTADHGDTGGSFDVTGSVVYTGTAVSPDDNGIDSVDVWTLGINDGDSSDTTLSSGTFSITCTADDAAVLDNFDVIVVVNGGGSGGTDLNAATQSDTYISDNVTATISWYLDDYYSVFYVGQDAVMTYIANYSYDDASAYDVVSLNDTDDAHSVEGYYGYKCVLGSNPHGITVLEADEVTLGWTEITYQSEVFWSTASGNAYLHMSVWDLNLTLVNHPITQERIEEGILLEFRKNDTLFMTFTEYYNCPDDAIFSTAETFDPSWRYVELKYDLSYTNTTEEIFISIPSYGEIVWEGSVPSEHTLYLEIYSFQVTDNYLWIEYETNWHNATLFYFIDGVYTGKNTNGTEGLYQIGLPTTAGSYDFTFVINATDYTGTLVDGTDYPYSNEQDYTGTDADSWVIREKTVTVSLTCYFNLYMSDSSPIPYPWGFKIYVNGSRLAMPYYTATSQYLNLTITDLWNATVYQDLALEASTFIDVVTDCYTLVIYNQQDFAAYAIIEFNSINRTYYIPAHGAFEYRIYTGSYTINIYRADNDELIQTEEGTVTEDWVVYTEKYVPPAGGGGGGVITIYDFVSKIALWLFMASISTYLAYRYAYPWLKKKWEEA